MLGKSKVFFNKREFRKEFIDFFNNFRSNVARNKSLKAIEDAIVLTNEAEVTLEQTRRLNELNRQIQLEKEKARRSSTLVASSLIRNR